MTLRRGAIALFAAVGFCFALCLTRYQGWQHTPALFFLLTGLGLVLMRRGVCLPSSGVAVCVVLFWGLCALSFLCSAIPFASQMAFCLFCAFPLAFFAGGAEKDMGRGLAYAFGPVYAGLALWAVGQNLFLPHGPYGARAMGPTLDPNMLAAVFNLGLVAYAGVAAGIRARREKILALLLSFLCFAGLVATQSRGGLVAGLAGLGVLCFFLRPGLRALLPILGGGIAVLLVLPWLAGWHLWSGFGALLAHGNPSVTDRVALWRASWGMVWDHPFLGSGPGTFSFFYPAHRIPLADASPGFFAHCDPLQMATEMGLGAAALFYALGLAVFLRTRAGLRAAAGNPALRLSIITPFAALLTAGLQAHISFPLYNMGVLVGCGVLLGVWHQASIAALDHGDMPLSSPGRHVFLGGFAVVAVAILALSGTAAMANYELRRAKTLKNPEDSLKALALADKIGPDSFIGPEVEMARINLALILRSGKITSPHMKEELLEETDRLLRAAAAWNPAWAEIDYLKGEKYQAAGQKGPMLESWMTALRKNPMHFATRRALAKALRTEGHIKDAAHIAEGGLLYPHPLAYRHWASAFLRETIKP